MLYSWGVFKDLHIQPERIRELGAESQRQGCQEVLWVAPTCCWFCNLLTIRTAQNSSSLKSHPHALFSCCRNFVPTTAYNWPYLCLCVFTSHATAETNRRGSWCLKLFDWYVSTSAIRDCLDYWETNSWLIYIQAVPCSLLHCSVWSGHALLLGSVDLLLLHPEQRAVPMMFGFMKLKVLWVHHTNAVPLRQFCNHWDPLRCVFLLCLLPYLHWSSCLAWLFTIHFLCRWCLTYISHLNTGIEVMITSITNSYSTVMAVSFNNVIIYLYF